MNPNKVDLDLYWPVCKGDIPTVIRLLKEGANPRRLDALYNAAYRGYVEIVRVLLEAGADPNSQDALYLAAKSRNYRVLRILLEAGANPNQHYRNTEIISVIRMMQCNLCIIKRHRARVVLKKGPKIPNDLIKIITDYMV